jgi:inorganic triphosphatase YgiF
MSVALGKHNALDDAMITPSKHFKCGDSINSHIISLVTDQEDHNIELLGKLFRRYDSETLRQALRSCDHNLEKTIEMLGTYQTTGKSTEAATKAIDTVMSATTEQDAIELLKSAVEDYDSETKNLASSLGYDNRILKKAFRTLLNKLSQNLKSD